MTAAWAATEKKWRFAFVGSNGTLSSATTLSGDDKEIIIASCEGSPSIPSEIATAVAVAAACREAPNFNHDNVELPLYPPSNSDAYITSEVESALAGGVTPLVANRSNDRLRIVRLITSMTTYASAPFERLKDFATINTLVYVARQIETAFLQQFANANKSARVNKQMAAVAFQILKNMENLEYLENVDELFAQLAVEDDPTVLTRALVSIPADPVDNLHQIVTKLVLF